MVTSDEKPSRLDFILALQTLGNYAEVEQLAHVYRIASGEAKQLVENAILQAINTCGYCMLVELLGEEGISEPIKKKGSQRLKKLRYEAIKESERLQHSLEILSDPKNKKAMEAIKRMTRHAFAGIEFEVPLDGDLEKTVESMSRLPEHVIKYQEKRKRENARIAQGLDSLIRTSTYLRRMAVSKAFRIVERYLSGNVKIDLVDRGKRIKDRHFPVCGKNRQKLKS